LVPHFIFHLPSPHQLYPLSLHDALPISHPSTVACSAVATAEQATVEGWVIDSACTYSKNLSQPKSVACAKSCARAGSPLVILTEDRKSTRLNSSHRTISYAVFCLKKKNK